MNGSHPELPAERKSEMDDKLNDLIAAVTKLQDAIATKKEEGATIKILHVLEKLVIPIMLGVLAWIGTQAGAKISEGQLRLSESAAEDRKVEFRRSMQAKYIEICYKDINSGDPKSQMNAIRLVRLVDSELAQNLLDLVPGTPGITQAAVAKAGEVKNEIAAVAPLSGYSIGIYYLDDDSPSLATAQEIAGRIKDAGFSGVVRKFPSKAAFYERVVAPSTIEIRYEPGYEDDAADALLSIVPTSESKLRWSKKPVSNRTANFISIFVPRGG
jgi:hypothetical protein